MNSEKEWRNGAARIGVLLVSCSLALAACENGKMSKETAGGLVGGGFGALLGSQVGSGKGKLVGVALGGVLGALAGTAVGRSLDRADRAYAERTSHRALETTPSGSTSSWNNPDSGNNGTITPVRTIQQQDGTYCREFQQTVMVGGQSEKAFGTACRQPDGTWKIVSAQ